MTFLTDYSQLNMTNLPLEIDVRGTAEITREPERAVLSIGISSEGAVQDVVAQQVSSTCNQLQQSFDKLAPKTSTGEATPEAPIATVSTNFLRSWSYIPYDTKGKALQRVYGASSSFEVVFRDFETLGNIASELFLMPYVTINHIEWCLTDPSLHALGAESRKLAMQDAIAKANDYANFVGRKIVPVKITDQGVSNGGLNMQLDTFQAAESYRRSGRAGHSAPNGMSLTPEKVVLTGSIHVKFSSIDSSPLE